MRSLALAVVLSAVAALGAFVPAAAAATSPSSTAKVAIIVGAGTPEYIADAEQLYAEAILYTPNVVRVYTPNATWSAVQAATTNANVVIYLGHGNGWPSPYTFDPLYKTKDGFGLNATAGSSTLKYYGEPSVRTLSFAPNAAVFLFHLCYASGNSEPTKPAPSLSVAQQRATNFASAFIAAGAAVVIADGHSHTPWYLRELFTTSEPISQLWRSAPDYHAHDIAFTPIHTTTGAIIPGSAFLDPDQGPTSPSGFYRSFVGQADRLTSSIIGRLPVGSITLPTRDGTTTAIVPRGTTTTGVGAPSTARRRSMTLESSATRTRITVPTATTMTIPFLRPTPAIASSAIVVSTRRAGVAP
jgi:hypothetical protein